VKCQLDLYTHLHEVPCQLDLDRAAPPQRLVPRSKPEALPEGWDVGAGAARTAHATHRCSSLPTQLPLAQRLAVLQRRPGPARGRGRAVAGGRKQALGGCGRLRCRRPRHPPARGCAGPGAPGLCACGGSGAPQHQVPSRGRGAAQRSFVQLHRRRRVPCQPDQELEQRLGLVRGQRPSCRALHVQRWHRQPGGSVPGGLAGGRRAAAVPGWQLGSGPGGSLGLGAGGWPRWPCPGRRNGSPAQELEPRPTTTPARSSTTSTASGRRGGWGGEGRRGGVCTPGAAGGIDGRPAHVQAAHRS
jgi:hypothetical protein